MSKWDQVSQWLVHTFLRETNQGGILLSYFALVWLILHWTVISGKDTDEKMFSWFGVKRWQNIIANCNLIYKYKSKIIIWGPNTTFRTVSHENDHRYGDPPIKLGTKWPSDKPSIWCHPQLISVFGHQVRGRTVFTYNLQIERLSLARFVNLPIWL